MQANSLFDHVTQRPDYTGQCNEVQFVVVGELAGSRNIRNWHWNWW